MERRTTGRPKPTPGIGRSKPWYSLLLMNRVLILLLSVAAITLPIQAGVTGGDCCPPAPDPQASQLSEADACCDTTQADRDKDEQREQPDRDQKPCNDCSRPCCSAPLIVPAPAAADRPRVKHAPTVVARPAELGSRRSPHLDRLDRPPKPPFPFA